MSVGLNLIFVLGVIRERIWCWPFGILGSLAGVYLFIDVKLYSEAILYSFYVLFGIYGWWNWTRPKKPLSVNERSLPFHIAFLLLGLAGALGLGSFFDQYSDAEKPYEDAFSTIFSFIATFFEAKKILSSWIYWIGLNTFSVYLYYSRGLEIYGALMILYFVLSVIGYLEWRKKYQAVNQ